MNELQTLRAHAQEMAASGHGSACPALIKKAGAVRRCPDPAEHASHDWNFRPGSDWAERICPGYCNGCADPAEVRLWRQIADEIGAHLEQPDEAAEQEALPI